MFAVFGCQANPTKSPFGLHCTFPLCTKRLGLVTSPHYVLNHSFNWGKTNPLMKQCTYGNNIQPPYWLWTNPSPPHTPHRQAAETNVFPFPPLPLTVCCTSVLLVFQFDATYSYGKPCASHCTVTVASSVSHAHFLFDPSVLPVCVTTVH